ncbi:transporter substrate-binding domain-containing protein [Sulfurimonas sp. MAG313]|nr:transporter substrate-binding domain-containing protein [Sulfurimonas sp. MAG313]MDF1879975.1 transporter substrate-binding domain-containing protein [Sulfurimonas sp. MAG313]
MKSVFILLFLFISSCVFAEDSKEIIIASESWKGATNRDGSGLYWKVLEKVYLPLGYTIIKKHKNYEASKAMVHSNNADIYLGAYKNENSFANYPKYYFDQDIVLVVYRSDSIEKWEGQKSLNGMTVGWIRGYDYNKYLDTNIQVKESNNRSNGLKQLKSQRLDAFLDDRRKLKPYLKRAKLSPTLFKQKIIFQLKFYPAFTQTPKGRKLMKIWDERMKILIKTEDFKRLYFDSDYAIFPY